MKNIFDREVEYKFFRETIPELFSSDNTRGLKIAMQYGLTPAQRQTLMMYYIDRMTPTQIAQQRGVCPSTVCRTLQRAKRNLCFAARFIGVLPCD